MRTLRQQNQQRQSHRSPQSQRATLRCPRSPRKRSDAYFMYASRHASLKATGATPQVTLTSARSQLARQGAVKRDGIDLLVMPSKLNGRLPARWLRSVDPLRGLAKPRNLFIRGTRRGPTSPGTRQRSADQSEPRRRPCCRHRSWRSGHRARGSSRRAPPGRQA